MRKQGGNALLKWTGLGGTMITTMMTCFIATVPGAAAENQVNDSGFSVCDAMPGPQDIRLQHRQHGVNLTIAPATHSPSNTMTFFDGMPIASRTTEFKVSKAAAGEASTAPTTSIGHKEEPLHRHLSDSGANCNVAVNASSFKTCRRVDKVTCTDASGTKVKVLGIGTIEMHVIDDDGNPAMITVDDCLHIPTFAQNIVSVGKMQG